MGFCAHLDNIFTEYHFAHPFKIRVQSDTSTDIIFGLGMTDLPKKKYFDHLFTDLKRFLIILDHVFTD